MTALDSIRAIRTATDGHCGECFRAWPCPTIRALAEPDEGLPVADVDHGQNLPPVRVWTDQTEPPATAWFTVDDWRTITSRIADLARRIVRTPARWRWGP